MSIKHRHAHLAHAALMEPRHLPDAERQAPRYMSYRPPRIFTDAAGGRSFSDWLNALPEPDGLSVYVHVSIVGRCAGIAVAIRMRCTETSRIADFVDTILRVLAPEAPAGALVDVLYP